MKHIVITGGTRGIGLGLTLEFLKKGNQVTFSGTSEESIKKALKSIPVEVQNNANGMICNVTEIETIEALWRKAAAIAPIDIWINNAGITQPDRPLYQVEPSHSSLLIDINIKGLIHATGIAYNGMLMQGFGTIYNMEGFGSDNRKMKNIGLYGMSKKAVRYYTESFALEATESPVNICFLSPGMVITDLLLKEYREDPSKNREAIRIFNILADEVETVTPWLVEKILTNKKHGKRIAWLTTPKIISRFLMSIFRKRDIISKHLK